jgi:SAM-dependent methyltransferase
MKVFISLFSLLLLIFNSSYPHLYASEINSKGIWAGTDVQCQHYFDVSLGAALLHFFQAEGANQVVDFGCGMGDYQALFLQNNLYTEAFDGNPDTPFLTEGRAGVQDLSVPFELGKRFDWVMSLEVGEHLPKEFERIFVENLIRHAQHGIVLSWAIPGQGGYGHFNEQNNSYIKDLLASYGWYNDVVSENHLREKADIWWFKNTIMIFRKL